VRKRDPWNADILECMTALRHTDGPQSESSPPAVRPRREESPVTRLMADGRPGVLGARGVLALQRHLGNAAVGTLLGRASAPGPEPVVQTYVVTSAGSRLSENANILKKSDHELYATENLVDDANRKLKRPDASHIGLGISTRIPFNNGKTYAKVRPEFHHHAGDTANDPLATANPPSAANLLTLWADCGRSSRVVMGVKGGTPPRARWREGRTASSYRPKDYSDEIYVKVMRRFLVSAKDRPYLVEKVHYTGSPRVLKYPATADEARAQYAVLPEYVQRHLDKWARINSGANPDVGGGYTMNTEYTMPGSAEVPGRGRWNFHWAGVVLKDGTDNVTLENYAVASVPPVPEDYDIANRDWNFEMYGTVKKGQTFHDQHLATGTHGTRASTFEVEPTP
jgi:hypothetical protein